MSEEEDPEEKRQAVVVGINEYKDPEIPKLTGAVNDATEIKQKLVDFGHFEITNDHFLLDSEATFEKIRKAISDLLYKTDPCNLAIFYFSGHGFRDSRGNGYIAPCNMLKKEPFVYGINMQELKQIVLSSINKSSVLMILDCCYSGIPTEGARGDESIPDMMETFDPYFENCIYSGLVSESGDVVEQK